MKEIMENFTLSTFLRHLFCGVIYLVSLQRATGTLGHLLTGKEQSSTLVLGTLALTAGVLIYSVQLSLINSVMSSLRHTLIGETKFPLWTTSALKTVKERWAAAAEPEKEKQYFQKKLSEGADYVHLQISCAAAIGIGALLGYLQNGKAGEPAWDLIASGLFLAISGIVSDVRRHGLQKFLFK